MDTGTGLYAGQEQAELGWAIVKQEDQTIYLVKELQDRKDFPKL